MTPVEHNHYGEANSYKVHCLAEEEARQNYPDLVVLQSDLVFGEHASALYNIIKRIANNKPLHFNPSKSQVSPIDSHNLAELASKLLGNDSKGVSYIAKGAKSYDWNQILSTLEKGLGKKANKSGGVLDIVASPSSNSFFSELYYSSCYRNLVQLINKYEAPNGNYSDAGSLGVTLKEFDYAENSLKSENYKCPPSETGSAHCGLKWLFG